MFRGYRSLRLSVVVLLVLAVLAPVAVFAAGGTFTDDDDSMFEVDIEWMAASGITIGCNPPANDNFCPESNVTRGQMAVFMHRLADNQLVDAAKLAGEDPAYYESMLWANDVEFGPLAQTLITGGASYVDLDIDVPYDGYLKIDGGATLYDPDSDVQAIWWIEVDGTCFADPDGLTQAGFAYVSVDTNRRQSASFTGGVAIDAGEHTISLCGTAQTSAGAFVYGPNLTVLFTTAGMVDM
ncbi:MAG: S-layer homology domain-containing protein [bacterium]|nr:S-layer homology domain-containing protein [bacterium]MCP4965969.1 S-layer homology domain-containing protein [bacterium]